MSGDQPGQGNTFEFILIFFSTFCFTAILKKDDVEVMILNPLEVSCCLIQKKMSENVCLCKFSFS